MSSDANYIELVEKAQLGDEGSLNLLAELARERLRVFVYRLALEEHRTQDIVQESMLEMFKILGQLKNADRFWPWLYRIALNKFRHHHRAERRQSTAQMSQIGSASMSRAKQEGLEKLVGRELKQIVTTAMRALTAPQRAVLCMRCYDEMSYSEIADSLGCTELAARRLFYRAKKSLQKQLSRQGLGKGSLLTALVLFGKMTAPNEAAAAGVSVTAATTKVGVAASVAVMAGSKAVVLPLVTAGVLTVGAVVATSGPGSTIAVPDNTPFADSRVAVQTGQSAEAVDECWYYFPESAEGPVMMWAMKSDSKGNSTCVWRQNEKANYRYDSGKNTVYVVNHRIWRSDLAVWRLPTDRPGFRQFLSRSDGLTEQMDYVSHPQKGLLVINGGGGEGSPNRLRTFRHRHLFDEEFFLYDWPAGVRTVDRRDAMHKRGWTYFTIEGRIDGERVSGTGRLPFVYEMSQDHTPWLRLKLGNRLKIEDNGIEALVYDSAGKVTASYAGGSFFKGLARPWMGLHTIDTVRRDAAEQQVPFETEFEPEGNKAKVTLGRDVADFVYTIDMETDVVDSITISAGDAMQGQLSFAYLQDIEEEGDEFIEPRVSRSYGSKRRASPGILWLLQLVTRGS
ncbi:MAG: RNA polymerase sigma factor [Planctomycetota bacterium]|jgi:RNA polymerase sigma-70 factor (ECF subfamily)